MTEEQLKEKMREILVAAGVRQERADLVMFRMFDEGVAEWVDGERVSAWDAGYNEGVAEIESNTHPQEDQYEAGRIEGYTQGRDDAVADAAMATEAAEYPGNEENPTEVYNAGYDKGYNAGYDAGHDDGYDTGRDQ